MDCVMAPIYFSHSWGRMEELSNSSCMHMESWEVNRFCFLLEKNTNFVIFINQINKS